MLRALTVRATLRRKSGAGGGRGPQPDTRRQVVISEEQDALLTRTAYELSSPERLISKSEVVRLAIEKIARELGEGEHIDEYRTLLEADELADDQG
jgi:hypothetical protein